MAKDEKQAALDAALKKIEKNFGKGAVMRMGEKADTQISTVPTGSLALDAAIGVGGYPRGRIIEILYRCRKRNGSGLRRSFGRGH